MKRTYVMLTVAAALAASSVSPLTAQTPIRLGVYTAIEVEYPTQLGKSYTLQGSSNLLDWSDVGELLPGTGRTVNRIFSTKNGAEVKFNNYRLRMADGPTNGFAPWAFSGITVELDDEPGGDVTKFLTDTTGEDLSEGDTDAFTYLYSRLGDNQGKAEITYASNRTEVLTFEFTGLGVGTWSRDEFRNGKLKDHDAGPFRIVGVAPVTPGTNATVVNPNVVIAPPVAPPAPPVSLSNLIYYFQASGIPDRYEFVDGSNGREVQGVVQEGLPTNSLVYTYTVLSSNTAFLRLSFGYYGMGGDRYDCDLTFTDGSSGHFVRHLYRRGVLKDTDEGAFSQDSQLGASGSGNNSTPPPASTNTASTWPPVVTPTAPPAPPAAMLGKTYYVYTSPSPDEYRFVGGNYGYATPNAVRTDEVETTPGGNVYMFTYTSTGSNTASLVITYGYYNLGGDREEYDLTYVDGSTATFDRRLYRVGTLYTNQSGIFSTNATLPYAYNPGGGSGSTNNGTLNTNPPPAVAQGYTLNTSTGEHIAFNTATTGLQTDNSNPTDFTYTYVLTSASTAALHVQMKPDRWDDYTLYFNDGGNGSFSREQYKKSQLSDTDGGTFTVTVHP